MMLIAPDGTAVVACMPYKKMKGIFFSRFLSLTTDFTDRSGPCVSFVRCQSSRRDIFFTMHERKTPDQPETGLHVLNTFHAYTSKQPTAGLHAFNSLNSHPRETPAAEITAFNTFHAYASEQPTAGITAFNTFHAYTGDNGGCQATARAEQRSMAGCFGRSSSCESGLKIAPRGPGCRPTRFKGVGAGDPLRLGRWESAPTWRCRQPRLAISTACPGSWTPSTPGSRPPDRPRRRGKRGRHRTGAG